MRYRHTSLVFFLICIIPISNSLADQSIADGSYAIVWDVCKYIKGSTKAGQAGRVSISEGIPIEIHCIKKGTTVVCDYVHEITGEMKNQPSIFRVDAQSEEILFLTNENHSVL